MATATYFIIAGIVLGALCAWLTIWGHGRLRDLVSVFLVVGILAAAVGVTINQVTQYRQQHLAATTAATATAAGPVAASGSSMPPTMPRAVEILPPLGMRGPSGAAAPAAAPNPYAGGGR